MQVEAKRRRWSVSIERRAGSAIRGWRTGHNRRIDGDPFRCGPISRHSYLLTCKRHPCKDDLSTRRVGAVIRRFGVRRIGDVQRQCNRRYRRPLAGVATQNCGDHFAARKQCRVEPEHQPGHHQSGPCEPAPIPWPTGHRCTGDALRPRQPHFHTNLISANVTITVKLMVRRRHPGTGRRRLRSYAHLAALRPRRIGCRPHYPRCSCCSARHSRLESRLRHPFTCPFA